MPAATSPEHAQLIRALTRGGVAMLANSALTALFGVLFWLVAARLLTQTSVGRGSALVSALLIVSAVCQLNYARALSRLIPLADRPRKLLGSVYGITVALSIVIGLGAAFVLPRISPVFANLRGDVFFIACFTVAVGIWSIFNLEDAALTSVRRATIMPFENGAYGLLKLICIVALWRFGYRGGIAIFVAWILPLVVVIIPVNLYLFLRAVPASGSGVPPSALRKAELESRSQPWLRYDFAGYMLWLAGTLPLPLLVLLIVGPAESAIFYVAFTIAQAIDILSLNLGNSLTAELAQTGGVLTEATKSFLLRVWTAVAILSALTFVLAPEVLEVFGDKYRAGGTLILRTFMVATLCRSVLFMGIAILRSRGDGRSILLLQSIAALGTLSLGLVLTHVLGAVGTSLAWAVSSCLAACVAVLLLRPGGRRARRAEGAERRPEAVGVPPPIRPARGVTWHLRRAATAVASAMSATLVVISGDIAQAGRGLRSWAPRSLIAQAGRRLRSWAPWSLASERRNSRGTVQVAPRRSVSLEDVDSLNKPETTESAGPQTARHPLLPGLPAVARTLLPFAALGIGFLAMKRADVSAIGVYGLVQALPPLYYVAFALATLSFLITWNSSRFSPLRFSFDLLVLVLLLQGPPAIIEPEARFPTAWLTAGFTDFVAHTGHVLPGIDARFSWPGFFAGVGMLARAGGLPSTILLLKWWPVALNLLYLPPFYLLARSMTGNSRRAALATWLFPLANWVGQDYFSPQSVAFLLYLIFVWIIVDQFGAKRRKLFPWRPWRQGLAPDGPPATGPPASGALVRAASLLSRRGAQQDPLPDGPQAAAMSASGLLVRTVGLLPRRMPEQDPQPGAPQTAVPVALGLLVLTAVGVAISVSHQITPVFAGLVVVLLAFFGRTRLKAFGVLMLLFTAGWLCYAAVTFWVGHFDLLFGGLGNLGGNVNASLVSRFKGTPQHRYILDVRLVVACFIWGLAALGLLVGYRRRLEIRTPAILMVAPLLVLSGGRYGGEAGLRAYLFSLVGALPLLAMLFPVAPSFRSSLRSSVAGALITALLVPGFVLARWGNELSEMTRPDDLAAIRTLYRIAPSGATLVSVTQEVPWRFAAIDRYKYSFGNLDAFIAENAGAIVGRVAHDPRGGYVLITTGQLVFGEQTYGQPKDWGTRIERSLTSSGRFVLVYSNPDAKIYKYKKPIYKYRKPIAHGRKHQ
jgi:O-antigen/teichoic acid export membrane protein